MGKKGGVRHQKRLASPALWPIPRKMGKWAPKTKPGPHPIKWSFPMVIVLRDILKLARNKREVQYILTQGKIKVDGKIRRELNFPVGLMDVIEITELGKYYRVVPAIRKGLQIKEIPKEEASYKLCRIEGKTVLKKGAVQLNLHDGRNIYIPVEDPKARSEGGYATRDVIKIKIPSQEIIEHYKFQEGIEAVVIRGKNVGRVGSLESIQVRFGPHASIAALRESDGTLFETSLDYVFATKPSSEQLAHAAQDTAIVEGKEEVSLEQVGSVQND
ncbi:MAG: 30S ribosomal protein S4e [Candidatus Ranarchaeia archaeon]